MFENIKKKQPIKKKTHKDVAKESEPKALIKPKKVIKPFKEGTHGFTKSTISIPNDFARFLHEEVIYGNPIQKKQLTKVIMELLGEKYSKQFEEWNDAKDS